MFNYKKSLLSIAAATALAVTSVSADYIPLTDTGSNEQAWTLFGVTGLQISGAGAGTSAGTFSITDNTANAVTDNIVDELFVEGLKASTGEDLGKIKAISPLGFIEGRVDTSGAVFNETEPIRTMYITLTAGGGPSFAFAYRASLEGRRLEYSRNSDGSNARSVTISSANTYSNPAYGEIIQELAGIPGAGLVKLTDIVDYDFSDNPIDSAYYDKDATPTQQQTAGANQYLRVYSYDAATQVWGLYDSRNAAEANDFDTLEKGKAYWAKMDDDTAATVGGLVLGSSSISAADYVTAGITDGWNLMAFDKANPDIRKSSTGLIVTVTANGADLRIYDASGNHSVDATVDATSQATLDTSAKTINQAIKAAKVKGLFPDTFDLRAFPISATQLALISSKRFIISEVAGDAITVVDTLTGKDPYSIDVTDLVNTDDVSTGGIVDLGVLPVGMDAAHSTYLQAMSKYGEYAMVVESIYLAQAAGASRIHLQSASGSATQVTAIAEGANLAATVTALGNGTTGVDIGGENAYAYGIDTDATSTNDKILIASAEPFYIRDHTFTRVFKYTDTNLDGDVYVKGTGTDSTVTPLIATNDATAAAAILNAAATISSVVDPSDATQFVIIADADDSNEFTITEATTTDHLEDAVSSSDLAKGAVKGVYSLGNLATVGLVNTVASLEATNVGDGLTTAANATDSIIITATTLNGALTPSTSVVVGAAAIASTTTYAAFLKSEIEDYLSANSVSYDSVTVIDAASHSITIVSSEVISFSVAQLGTADTLASTDDPADEVIGAPDTLTADLAADLKFNAVYTPNYVVDGPLYTMKDSGFTLKAMVTGTTDISDGSVNWDSIDLTRKPSEWLNSQDYNLFKVDEKSGYWAYLETDTGSNNLVISNAALSPLTYTYHFNKVGVSGTGTNYNHVSGNIALTIDGLDNYDDRKSAVIKFSVAGSSVELAKEAGSDVYNGKLSSYEIESMPSGFSYEIFANLSDGLGYNKKSLNTGLVVDYAKPDAPSIALGDGTAVVLTSTSADVAGYYIFEGQIPEVNPAGATTLFKKVSLDEATGYGLCQDTAKLAWFESPYKLNVIAVDVTGVLGQGNVSDTTEQKYVPMLKDMIRLENSRSGALVATTEGIVYDTSCVDQGLQTQNYGVTLTATIDLTSVSMSYKPKSVTDTTATPISLFVSSGGSVAKITYADVYVGDTVYVKVGSAVYSLLLPSLSEIETDDTAGIGARYGAAGVGASTANPLPLVDGQADEDTTSAGVAAANGYAELQIGQSL